MQYNNSINNTELRLSKNQRNLYNYYLAHQKKYKNTPCFVPKNPMLRASSKNETKDESYIRIIETLERMNLFRVDRSSERYTQWILMPVSRSNRY